ncbi:uncharacterized protein FA14DRAFT_21508 [Meira miltonrushii]|uniref:Uncharacterized protein n=1 Tax=Meira miltonrushii TaxID=1280837 RepID=A0A316VK86_9BASI|nr:uncharacterized protein FA14DRAFT_21508 [Meira miltonrushii]PWN37966.1 hypothetical protein FA14DRAFT_21508 [Meira miltonrushii]
MYVPVQPFSPNGVASKLLTWYLTRINLNGVTISQGNITCTGSSNCVIPLFDERIMALSVLDKTHAQCTKKFKGQNDNIDRYSGICKRDNYGNDIADVFLAECKSNVDDYVLITYNKDNSNFTANGNARALFSPIRVGAIDLYKTQQVSNDVSSDVYLYCPTSGVV